MPRGCRPDAPSVEAQGKVEVKVEAEVEAKGETKGEAESGVGRRLGSMGEGGWERVNGREAEGVKTIVSPPAALSRRKSSLRQWQKR
jgi:hypothetical protein|tara:strand:- start:181 stop:441 length:261 start_codon:yes stop_codon:yes gene_type:complete